VSYQGKPVLAICLEDVAQLFLPYTTKAFRQCVKKDGLGATNISKDFLPSTSKSATIRRGSNCRSRKCTVVYMDELPQKMQADILEGMSLHFLNIWHDPLLVFVIIQLHRQIRNLLLHMLQQLLISPRNLHWVVRKLHQSIYHHFKRMIFLMSFKKYCLISRCLHHLQKYQCRRQHAIV